jgi:hypothetical protein
MIIYNVTIAVQWPIQKEWLAWMIDEHIPRVKATGYFVRHQMVRLLDVDETEGPTYAIQYFANDMEAYNNYIAQHSAALRKEGEEKWGNQFLAFRTLMEVVD